MLTKSASSSNPVKVCLRITWNIHVHNKIHVLGINSTRCLKNQKNKKIQWRWLDMAYVWITVKFLRKLSQTYQAMHRSCVSLACSRRSNLVWGWRRGVRKKNKNTLSLFSFLFFCDLGLHASLQYISNRLGFPQQVWWWWKWWKTVKVTRHGACWISHHYQIGWNKYSAFKFPQLLHCLEPLGLILTSCSRK